MFLSFHIYCKKISSSIFLRAYFTTIVTLEVCVCCAGHQLEVCPSVPVSYAFPSLLQVIRMSRASPRLPRAKVITLLPYYLQY